MHYIYFAQSLKNKKVYVGFTSKVPDKRVHEHNVEVVIGQVKMAHLNWYIMKASFAKQTQGLEKSFIKRVWVKKLSN